MAIEDLDTFIVSFEENPTTYSVEDKKTTIETFTAKHDKYINLRNQWINKIFVLRDIDQVQTYEENIDYEIDEQFGRIKALTSGNLLNDQQYRVEYTFFPIKNSSLLNGEASNSIFDGLKLFVNDDILKLDLNNTGWTENSSTNSLYSITPFNGNNDYMYAADYEIHFYDSIVDTGSLNGILQISKYMK